MVATKKTAQPKPVVLSRQAIIVLGLFLVVGALVFFAPYMGAVAISALMAYTFLPLYKFFEKKMPSVIASWLVVLVAFLAVIVPIAYIGFVVLDQSISAVAALSKTVKSEDIRLYEVFESLAKYVNIPGQSDEQTAGLIEKSVIGFVSVAVPSFISIIVDSIVSFASSLPKLMTSATIFAFLFSMLLRKNEQIGRLIYDLSPLDNRITGVYLQRSSQIVVASIKGQLLLSLMSATLSALLLILLGYGQYFLFLVVLFTLLGMIPAGSGLVVIPICLIYMFTQDFWLGFWVLMIYLIVIGNSETVVRPRLIPKNVDIIPALTILSVLSGIYYFGIMGVVYGPLLIILFSTTVDILVNQKKLRSKKAKTI